MIEAVRKFRNNKKKTLDLSSDVEKTGIDSASLNEIELKEIQECPNDLGAISYWNKNKFHYHVDQVGKAWSPCTNLHYTISE